MKYKLFWLGLVPTMLLFAALADAAVGHGGLFWPFTLVTIGLLVVMLLTSVSWFYNFMAVFFVLGCWSKVMAHHISDLPYVEPSGEFSNSAAEWQEYYLFALTIATALLLARLLTLPFWSRRLPRVGDYEYTTGPVMPVQWLRLIGVAAVYYLLNHVFAFFVTGVNAKLILPFGLNAPVAFIALIGFACVLAAYVAKDVQARGRLNTGAAVVVLIVTVIGSVSMASRAAIVMQYAPILLAAYYLQSHWGKFRLRVQPILFFVCAVLLVLVAVSIYRAQVFSGTSIGDADLMGYFLESALLVVDRWIGAEALMVAVAEPTRSVDLLFRLMAESPTSGVGAIYQQLSGGKYEFLQEMTFLTLPGYFGVVALSGEVALIFGLVLVMALSGLAYEGLINRLLYGQTIPIALICCAVANALTQLSFPSLFFPFIFQMTALAWLLGLYMRAAMGLRKRAGYRGIEA